VHVSQMANKFVSDAREVVKTGMVVKVRVLEVDLARKRVSLTMKLDAPVAPRSERAGDERRPAPRAAPRGDGSRAAGPAAPGGSAMAEAWARRQGQK